MSTSPLNQEQTVPLHHLLFLKIRDGGGAKVAHGVAEQHGISVDELKAQCRLAADELLVERGHLLDYELLALQWAKS